MPNIAKAHNIAEKKPQQPRPASEEPQVLAEQGPTLVWGAQRALLDSGRAGAAGILALQRTAGNQAVSNLLAGDRSPSRPPAVQARPDPGAAHGGHEQAAGQAPDRVMRATAPGRQAIQSAGGPRIQRSFLGGTVRALDLFNVLAPFRQFYLSKKHGIKIRAGSLKGLWLPFSHGMLNKIDKVLSQLPKSHLKDNPQLEVIKGSEGVWGAASGYEYEAKAIQLQRPFRIVMPPWLYLLLDKGEEWQRNVMDMGFFGGLNLGWIGKGNAQDLISSLHKELSGSGEAPKLQVMGGGKNVLLENLTEWTLRHEIGHSVDKMIGWRDTMASRPECGGWEVYSDFDGLDPLANRFLLKAGLAQGDIDRPGLGNTILTKFAGFMKDKNPLRAPKVADEWKKIWTFNFKEVDANTVKGIQDKVQQAIQWARRAMAQPWMLADGGGPEVTCGDRIYQVDEYDKWCSYLAVARKNALSNYQFAAVDEWFAEAYAAYYGKPEQKAKLSPETRDWFRDNVPQV